MLCKCSSTLWFPHNPACQGRHGFTSLPPSSFSQLFSFPSSSRFPHPFICSEEEEEARRECSFWYEKKVERSSIFFRVKRKRLFRAQKKKICRIYGEKTLCNKQSRRRKETFIALFWKVTPWSFLTGGVRLHENFPHDLLLRYFLSCKRNSFLLGGEGGDNDGREKRRIRLLLLF